MKIIQQMNKLLLSEPGHLSIYGKIALSIVIIIIVRLLVLLINRFIRHSVNSKIGITKTKTYLTLSKLLMNGVRYLFYFLGLIQILQIFGINTASIIATAGIGGLAIGLGAQFLVKDLIAGIFILIEERYNIGDYVLINGVDGVVTELGLKTTTIEGFDGSIHMINNGDIQMVTNKSMIRQKAVVEVKLPFDTDLDLLKEIVEEVGKDLEKKYPDKIKEVPEYIGITAFESFTMTIAIWAYTAEGQQWFIEREIRRALWNRIGKDNISFAKIPEGGQR
ncbi:MAG: mechanosensitive ion channel [Tissierellia bacterium]|nr:mechanosensitive ion channel [Tissierellia bacterium]